MQGFDTLNFKKKILLLVTGFFALATYAQKDTTHVYGEVEVVAPREKVFNAGTQSWKADSTTLAQYSNGTIADLLGQQSGNFIRTFTPGALATPLIRGTAFTHTAIVWNGFNLQSPMNQTIDLSLIPAFFVDEAELGYGSHSALYGSGAIGGTISLAQNRDEKEGVHGTLLGSVGSFGTFQQGVKLSYRKKIYTGRIRYFNHISQNNYPYRNLAEKEYPVEKLFNARVWNNGQLFENYYKFNEKIKSSLVLWHQQAYRGVPQKMIFDTAAAFQKDDLWRLTGDVKYVDNKIEGILRVSYFDERIRYKDPLTNPITDADNRAFGFIMEAEMRYRVNRKYLVSFGVNNSHYKSTARDYGTPAPVQYRPGIFISSRYTSLNKKILVSATLRQEAVTLRNPDDEPLVGVHFPGKFKFLPFIPSLGADWNFSKPFTLSAKASRVYRYPSFNDLYWSPGGNPNLLPEDGFSAETRLSFKKIIKKWDVAATGGVFYNDINNWIIWQPGLSGIWSPKNIQRVKSRGIETSLLIGRKLNKNLFVKADARYSYTLSTNEKKLGPEDVTYKKQLPYIPYHTVAGNITAGYRKIFFRINGQYTGQQYTIGDNSQFLPGFYTLNVFAGTTISVKKQELVLSLQAKNITGEEYMVTEWLPMPGRNYLLSITFKF